MESIEDLLAQVKADDAAKSPPPLPCSPVVPMGTPQGASLNSGAIDSLLADLRDEYRQKEQAQARERQHQQEEERRQQERLKQLQREALRRDAQAWLKKLDPLSGEGLWFAQFAEHYSSRLEAAMDYLEALNPVQL